MVSGPVEGSCSNPEVANATGGSTKQGGDMHTLLHEAFGMHGVSEDINCEPQAVNEEAAEGDTLNYHKLLRRVDKPLNGSTKHSKLSAIVHLYNLKCVGEISNTIFLALLEFIIQLLPALWWDSAS